MNVMTRPGVIMRVRAIRPDRQWADRLLADRLLGDAWSQWPIQSL